MESVEGARHFLNTGAAYDAFMGRYSRPLAGAFADFAGVAPGMSIVDLGCGPGALTGELINRVGVDAIVACDPSAPFVAECASRFPGLDVRPGQAEAIPFGDAEFDAVLAQLVLHFITDPTTAAAEMGRVVRPGGLVAACVWDFAEGMEMLRLFWDAALAVMPDAPDEARSLRFGGEGEIAEFFRNAAFVEVAETRLTVVSTYESFDELWAGFLLEIGPAGAYCQALSDDQRGAVRNELFHRVGSPEQPFSLAATARAARARRAA